MKKINNLRRTLLLASLMAASGMAQAQTVKLTLGHGTAIDNPRHVVDFPER